MKKYLFIIISFFYVLPNINAQNTSFYPNRSQKNEEKIKDERQYKSYYYTALKQKSLENYEEAIKYFEKCISLNKEQAAPYYEISKIYLLNNELEKSYNYSKQSYQLEKDNKWYSQFYAEILFKMQYYFETNKTECSLASTGKNLINNYEGVFII